MSPDDGRASAPYDQERAEKAVRELLLALGENPDREGLQETPARVARAFKENFEGLWQRPEDVLTTTFDIGHEELVIIRDIEVFSHCEHHLTPFHGVAHVGYIPSGKITASQKLLDLSISMRAARKCKKDSLLKLPMPWLKFSNRWVSLSLSTASISACRCVEYVNLRRAQQPLRCAEYCAILQLVLKQ